MRGKHAARFFWRKTRLSTCSLKRTALSLRTRDCSTAGGVPECNAGMERKGAEVRKAWFLRKQKWPKNIKQEWLLMKKTVFKTVIFAGMLLAANVYAAENSKKYVLSVEDAVKIAKEKNVSIKRQKITLDAALRAKKDSWNSVSPSVAVGASSAVPVDFLTGGDQSSDYNASFGVNASFLLSRAKSVLMRLSGRLNFLSASLITDFCTKRKILDFRKKI